jgi:hypothetical protein
MLANSCLPVDLGDTVQRDFCPGGNAGGQRVTLRQREPVQLPAPSS